MKKESILKAVYEKPDSIYPIIFSNSFFCIFPLLVHKVLKIFSLPFSEPKCERGKVFGAALILELTVQGEATLFQAHS